MADAAGMSPSRFLQHTAGASGGQGVSPKPSGAVAAIAATWKRRRDVQTSPLAARRAAGGATAPTTLAISSPPATRQRLHAFDVAGDSTDAKFENLRQQLIAEFGRVHQDIAALNTWNQAASADMVSTEAFDKLVYDVDQKTAAIDGLMANLGAQTIAVADRLTALEVENGNAQHREMVLMDKLKVLTEELQRWTTASAEQAAMLAALQEQADSVFAKAVANLNEGDEAMKSAIEVQVNILKSEVATLKMAASQAAIIRGSNETSSGSLQRAHGPFGAGNGFNGNGGSEPPTRAPPGVNAGKSPCHCHHLDTLKDRVDAAEARLAEADKFCDLLKARVGVLH